MKFLIKSTIIAVVVVVVVVLVLVVVVIVVVVVVVVVLVLVVVIKIWNNLGTQVVISLQSVAPCIFVFEFGLSKDARISLVGAIRFEQGCPKRNEHTGEVHERQGGSCVHSLIQSSGRRELKKKTRSAGRSR